MPHYPYLIVGGGMTAAAAMQGIREVDPTGAIGLIGLDPHPPYQRPPLSKGAVERQAAGARLDRHQSQGVDLHLGRTVQALDTRTKL